MTRVMIVLLSVALTGCTALATVGTGSTNFGLRDGQTRASLLGVGDSVQTGDGPGTSE